MSTKEEIEGVIESQLETIKKGDFVEQYESELAFYVAARVVEYQDVSFLKLIPLRIRDLINKMIDVYSRDGEYKIISNLGEVDHSEMVRELCELTKINL